MFNKLFRSYILNLNLFFKKPKKVALVLGGGAARGLAHIGVIKALEEHNISFDYVVGTSVGSLVGAFYAAGLTSAEMIEYAKTIKTKDIKSGLIPFVPSKTDGIKNVVVNALGNIDITDLKKHYCAVAVDVKSAREVHFVKGNLAEIVAASCAVPGVFFPVEYEDYVLYDGGLSNNLPSNVPKIVFGCDAVIAVDVNSTRGYGTDSTKYIDTIMASIRIMMKSNSLKGYLNSDLIIQPDLKRFKSTKLNNIDEMIMEGYNATIFQMEKIKNILNGKNKEKKIKKIKVNKRMV